MTEYKDYAIEQFKNGFIVYYQGDEIFFKTEKEAKEFIDEVEGE